MVKQIVKVVRRDYVKRNQVTKEMPKVEEKEAREEPKTKNKKTKKENNMTNEQLNLLEGQLGATNAVKVVKKERGLIERTESSKIILTEDNRQVLVD